MRISDWSSDVCSSDLTGGSSPHLFYSKSYGESDSSLHSKAIIFDRQKSFIGSFNFDTRSVLWNTEVGVLVDSTELAGQERELRSEEHTSEPKSLLRISYAVISLTHKSNFTDHHSSQTKTLFNTTAKT